MTRKRDSLAKLIMLIISNELDYVPVPYSVARIEYSMIFNYPRRTARRSVRLSVRALLVGYKPFTAGDARSFARESNKVGL